MDTYTTDSEILERDLRDFVASNLRLLDSSLELIGVEHEIDVGRIDVLAANPQKTEFTVIELKRGTAGRDVLGQIQSYMGSLKVKLAPARILGVIIAQELDPSAKAGLRVCTDVRFVRYRHQFLLEGTPPPPSDTPWGDALDRLYPKR